MSRLLSLSLLALLAFAVALPAHVAADSLAVSLPASATPANQTAVIPVMVTITVSQGNCPAGTSSNFLVDLKVDSSAGGDFSATLNPASIPFNVPAGESVQGDATLTGTSTLVVENRGQVAVNAANVTVTATAQTPDCGPLGTVRGVSLQPATASTAVTFKPQRSGNSTSSGEGEPVPGVGLPLLVGAFVVLALVARRSRSA